MYWVSVTKVKSSVVHFSSWSEPLRHELLALSLPGEQCLRLRRRHLNVVLLRAQHLGREKENELPSRFSRRSDVLEGRHSLSERADSSPFSSQFRSRSSSRAASMPSCPRCPARFRPHPAARAVSSGSAVRHAVLDPRVRRPCPARAATAAPPGPAHTQSARSSPCTRSLSLELRAVPCLFCRRGATSKQTLLIYKYRQFRSYR